MENPTNRYEAVLTRQATRQHINGVQKPANRGDGDSSQKEDTVGDVTLGLKMKIIAGKVIIQQVKPQLIDGTATPVAATKQIRRGDVILALNGKSLVVNDRDPGDATAHAIKLLEPINTPNEDGLYEKTVHLELARGEGLRLLERSEKAEEEFTNRPYTSSINESATGGGSGNRRGLFSRGGGGGGGGGGGHYEDEGYASFKPIVEANGSDDPFNKKKTGKHHKAKVGGAAAVAGIAGLALLGPVTAVAAAGGAAYVAHKKNKSRRNKNNNNDGQG